MTIKNKLWIPLQDTFHPPSRLRMHQKKPVPVEVKQIVITSAIGPDTSVVEALDIAAGNNAVVLLHLFHKTHTPVRVLHRVNTDHHIIQNVSCRSVLPGQKLVSKINRSIHAGNFISMYAVSHPCNSWKGFDQFFRLSFVHLEMSQIRHL